MKECPKQEIVERCSLFAEKPDHTMGLAHLITLWQKRMLCQTWQAGIEENGQNLSELASTWHFTPVATDIIEDSVVKRFLSYTLQGSRGRNVLFLTSMPRELHKFAPFQKISFLHTALHGTTSRWHLQNPNAFHYQWIALSVQKGIQTCSKFH